MFILLAMDKYFNAYEKVTPNFVNQVWLGTAYAGEQKFAGRSVDSQQLEIPMDYLMKQGGVADLIMNKQGDGRLYYRIGMKYAPKNLNLKPADYGFTVLRSYEAVDKPDDVKQEADGKWTIKAGARVRVKLTMVAQARRYHVALVDPLPAGLEILNPGLAVTEEIPAAPPEAIHRLSKAEAVRTDLIRITGARIGLSTRTSVTNAPKHSVRWSGAVFITIRMLRERRHRANSSSRRQRPRRCIIPETFGRTGTDFVNVK